MPFRAADLNGSTRLLGLVVNPITVTEHKRPAKEARRIRDCSSLLGALPTELRPNESGRQGLEPATTPLKAVTNHERPGEWLERRELNSRHFD